MTGKLFQRHSADVATALQLSHIFGYRIVEAELDLLNGLRKQRGCEQLADRPQIEYRVGCDGAALRIAGHAVVKEGSLTTHMDRYRNSSSLAVLRQYRLNLLLSDLFNIKPLRSCRPASQQNP